MNNVAYAGWGIVVIGLLFISSMIGIFAIGEMAYQYNPALPGFAAFVVLGVWGAYRFSNFLINFLFDALEYSEERKKQ